jgi:branched-chain amino acid transport system permease protein
MEFWIGYLDQALIFAIYAIALNVLIGYAGIFSIGSAAFGAFGGYATALLMLHLEAPAILALLAGAVIGAAISLVISGPILRLSAEYVMLMTLSLSILTVSIIVASPELGSQQGLINLPLAWFGGVELLRPTQFLPWFALFLVVAVAIVWVIAESPLGRSLRAAKDDVVAVRSLGKAPLGGQLFVFATMSGLTAFAGGLLVLYNGIAAPSLFSLDQTMLVFAMVIVGGTGSIPGSIVGALLIIAVSPVLQQVLKIRPEDSALIRPIVFGLLLILIMRFRPVGLIPERHRVPKLPKGARTVEPVAEREAPDETLITVVDQDGPDGGPVAGERPEVVLSVRGIDKRFGGVHAVNDLSLDLRRGEITALVGPNGAGKSTVFNLVTGELRPDAGTVLLGDTDITRWSPDRVARHGMVRSFQDLRVFGSLTPIENVMMAGRPHPGENPAFLFLRPSAWRRRERELAVTSAEWLGFVGLDPGLRVPTRSLSFAQQKQVAFARVLATGAEITLLDEPLSGIEGSAAEEMLTLIERMRGLGHTICIVEHSIQAISRLADWGYFMENGTVTAEGRIDALLADPRLTEAYFGIS